MSRVLRQSTIPYLAQPKPVLDDVKGVFRLGADACLNLFGLFQHLTPYGFRWQSLTLPRLHGDMPSDFTVLVLFPFLGVLGVVCIG